MAIRTQPYERMSMVMVRIVFTIKTASRVEHLDNFEKLCFAITIITRIKEPLYFSTKCRYT